MRKATFESLLVSLAVALGTTLLLAAKPAISRAADHGTCSPQEEAATRKVVEMVNPTPQALYDAMAPNYIQHEPEAKLFGDINHVSGRKAMALLRKVFVESGHHMGPPPHMPGQPPMDFNYKVIVRCDTAVVIHQMWLPLPGQPGKFYAQYGFDMWLVKNGKLAEHWDDLPLPNPLPEYLKVPAKELKPAASAAAH